MKSNVPIAQRGLISEDTKRNVAGSCLATVATMLGIPPGRKKMREA